MSKNIQNLNEIEKIHRLVAEAKLEEVFPLLKSRGNITVILESRYNRIKDQLHKGAITFEQYNLEVNRINNAILEKLIGEHILGVSYKYLFFSILVISFILIGWRFYSHPNTNTVQAMLQTTEPELFRGTTPDKFEFARVLPDRTSLEAETNLVNTLDSAKVSYSLITSSASFMTSFSEVMKRCVIRGVKIRFLLLDTTYENCARTNYHAFKGKDPADEKNNIERHKIDVAFTVNVAKEIKKIVNLGEAKGNISIRFYRKPMLYTMWIKDAETRDGLVHLGLPMSFVGTGCFFRISPGSSHRLFESLNKQFEMTWEESKNLEINLD